MNNFTKEELEEIKSALHWKISAVDENSLSTKRLIKKIQDTIYFSESGLDSKKIANAHLDEALSLINHAKCLLGLDNE